MKNDTGGVTIDPMMSVEHWIVVPLCSVRPPIVSVDSLPPSGSAALVVSMSNGKMSTFSLLPFTLQKMPLVVETLHMYSCLSSIVTIKSNGEGTVMKSETKFDIS